MAKDKNGSMVWLKVVGLVLVVIVLGASVVAGFVSNSGDIEHNTESIRDHETRIRTGEEYMVEQRVDIRYIKDSVKRIEKMVSK